MSFPLFARLDWVPGILAFPLRLQTRVFLGPSRTSLVVAGTRRHSLLFEKAKSHSMVSLQGMAAPALGKVFMPMFDNHETSLRLGEAGRVIHGIASVSAFRLMLVTP